VTALDRIADFDLSEEQRAVRRSVREFAEKEIAPHVEEHEREERYPTELIQKLVPLGLIAPMIPERYGGGLLRGGALLQGRSHRTTLHPGRVGWNSRGMAAAATTCGLLRRAHADNGVLAAPGA